MGKFWIKSKVATDCIKDVRDLSSNELETPFEAEITCIIPEKEKIMFSLLFRTQHAQRMWIDAIRGLADLPALDYSVKEVEAETVAIKILDSKDLKINEPIAHKCRVRFLYREEYFTFIVTDFNISLKELAETIRRVIEVSLSLESQSTNDIPPVDRIRLRLKDSDDTIVRISSDGMVQDLLKGNEVLNLIVHEGEPVRVRFTYRECMYSFTVDDISALEELKMYVYETIAEDYRMINANMDAVPKGDSMRLFYKETNGEWSLLLYDNDLEVAMKLSNRRIDLKF